MAKRRRRRRRITPPAPSEEKRIEQRKKALEPAETGSETSADTNLVNAMETDPEFFKDPLIGQTIGKCRIEKYIGEGRTSVVYRAAYAPLKRTVAVKVLQPSVAKVPAIVKVFQQEGRAVAALDHENVLKIYDVGKDGSHHYLVLELLKGDALLKHIDEKAGMEVEEALEYIRQAANGLNAAHRKNIVHRDIKPHNLVIEPDGKLKIVDFGLAAEAEGAFSGGRLGTPHYMSPEVCRGEAARTASDIYALGITLYHMLVGLPPYSGRKSTEEIIQDHLKGKRLEPEKARKGIPRPVADLVRRMTKQDPKQRPTAREVRDYIQQRLSPEKLAGRGRPTGRRAGRRGRKKEAPVGLFILGGVLVLGIGGLLVALAGKDDGETEPGPKTVADQPVVEEPPTVKEPKQPEVEIAKPLEEELRDLIRDARQEEKTGNNLEAHHLWMRVLAKAPPESRYYRQAQAAAKNLKELLNKDAPVKKGEKRTYISVRESEEAGRRLVDGAEERRKRLGNFEIDAVKAELEDIKKNTREESPERGAVEITLKRLAYMTSLLSIIEARAASLPGDMAQWINFDMDAAAEILVVGANREGIQIKDDVTGAVTVKPWSSLDGRTRVDFIDAVRSQKNGTETMWLGYYCQLVGDDRADTYFEYATILDSSPEMLREIKALRGK